MTEPKRAPVVAVLNSSSDVVEMLREVLDAEGFHAVTAHVPAIKRGQADLLSFFAEPDPREVIYDIAPPDKENWTFFRLIVDTESDKQRPFLGTTTNKRAMDEQVGPTPTFELIGKP